MSGRGVYKPVNDWKRETVFWTNLVQASEIDTHSPLALGFLYHDHVRQPIGILYFPNKPGFKELLSLFPSHLNSIKG